MQKNSKEYALLCLARLQAIVEHTKLSDKEMASLIADVNALYFKHIAPPQQQERVKTVVIIG